MGSPALSVQLTPGGSGQGLEVPRIADFTHRPGLEPATGEEPAPNFLLSQWDHGSRPALPAPKVRENPFGSSPPVTPTRSSSLSQGPCFSPRSTRWPPHDGVRRAGGTILQTSSPEAGGSSRYNELARPAVPAGRTSARSADLLQLTRSMVPSGARSFALPSEAEVTAIDPHPVQDHREAAGGGDDRPLHAPVLGELEAPRLQPRHARGRQQHLGRLVQQGAQHPVAALRDPTVRSSSPDW